MRIYICDPVLLRKRLEQTLAIFFRDGSISGRITNAVIDTVYDVLESKDEEVRRQIKIAEEGIKRADLMQGLGKEGD